MRKTTIISLIILIGMIISTTKAFATTTNIAMNGGKEAKSGETKTIEVKILADEVIGVVSGKIETNANIEISSIENKNGWSCTYNKETGTFNTYKAEGAKEEVIFEITYKANSEGTGNIKMTEISVTNIEYDTRDISGVEANITITKKEESKKEIETKPAKDNKKDTANKQLPYTGRSTVIIGAIVIIMAIGIVMYKKYKYIKSI